MTILRMIPVNLLAVPAAVAERLASLAELASIGIQFNGANSALLSHFAKSVADTVHVLLPCRVVVFSSLFGGVPIS